MKRYAAFVVDHRLACGALLVLALLGSVWLVPRMPVDFSISVLLKRSRADQRELARFERDLPGRYADITVTLEWPDPIDLVRLAQLAQLADELRRLPGVSRVTSLGDIRVVAPGARGAAPAPVAAGVPVIRPFPELVEHGDVLAAARQHPLLMGSLVSTDGTAAAVIVARDRSDDHQEVPARKVFERVARVARSRAMSGARVRVLGSAAVDRAMAGSMSRDMLESGVLQIAVCVLVLAWLFRRVYAVVIPLASVVGAVLLFAGVTVLLSDTLTLIEVTVPGLILIIGLCDAIHMVHRFDEARARGLARRDAILDMMDHVGVACLFTSLTTAVGFLGLLSAEHRAVRDFAVSASIGVGVAFISVMTAIPLLLSLWPGVRAVAGRDTAERHARLRVSHGHPVVTGLASAAILGVSIWGLTRIDIDSRWLEELPRDHPVVADMSWYQTEFQGVLDLDVHISGPLDTLPAYRGIRSLERVLLAEPDVTNVDSYTLWIDEALGHIEHPGRDDLALGVLRLRMSGPDFPAHVVNPAFRLGRVRFKILDSGTDRFADLIALVDRYAGSLPAGVHARVAGPGRVSFENARLIVSTTLKSILVSLAVIAVLMALLFRSVRIGLISLIPNAAPVVVALGLAGFLGIPLRLGIIMIFSLGLGLSVDNTIHLITRYRQEQRERPGADRHALLIHSLHTTGRALATTTAVLALGTMCYLPASFRSLEQIGILLTTIVVTALVANLFVLPHLLDGWDRPR